MSASRSRRGPLERPAEQYAAAFDPVPSGSVFRATLPEFDGAASRLGDALEHRLHRAILQSPLHNFSLLSKSHCLRFPCQVFQDKLSLFSQTLGMWHWKYGYSINVAKLFWWLRSSLSLGDAEPNNGGNLKSCWAREASMFLR